MNETSPGTWLPDRALLRVGGEDVRGFLQGLVTQDLALVTPATPQWAGLLTPQGKALFDFLLWADGDAILIDCETTRREALARRLTLYRLRRPILIEPVEGGVHWSLEEEEGVADPRLPALGRRWLGPGAGSPATGWLAHRLGLGVIEGMDELGQDKTLWLECNAAELNGVSFTKGCYVGQENTARMHYRAKVNRRLVVAPLGEPGERTRTRYPDLGLMIELRRTEALGDAITPEWLSAALGGSPDT
ncbi:CAF17-like 4Fe-4S cluster assembly/insertion protein YgfZ [Sphingomonas psychrotolerans]|uniref:Folate-binding protein YgfZ n=1 Tax=Sphingomonas psychrotolerans TaxID=1327635 RepID=A0A2K8MHI2_9SPHN|nr:folate-binding protein YgfZ [Sphingomonas psychrotolerans]ATY33352.1 folate-binding protein YgfZ [Sphingomonas psychrotolerans]